MALKLQPGWDKLYSELVEMFRYDKNVHVIYDRDNYEVKLYVSDKEKAEALSLLIPKEYNFGSVTLRVNVVDPNTNETVVSESYATTAMIFSYAFAGNPVLSFTSVVEGVFSNPITYVVFAKLIAQFFNDNLNDVYGNCTMLYADMAKDIFKADEDQHVFFCTDKEDILTKTEIEEEPLFLDDCWP